MGLCQTISSIYVCYINMETELNMWEKHEEGLASDNNKKISENDWL